MRVIAAFFREPLLQFLAMGLVIFLFAEWRAGTASAADTRIIVDEGRLAYLENLYHVQFGVYPDRETLEQLVENHVRDEVLFREAIQLGLARQDEIIRRRLIQKMEYVVMDSGLDGAPDESVLRDYHAAHAGDYRQPAQLAFRHLYFSPDGDGGEEAARHRAEQVREKLAGTDGADMQPAADPFPLQNRYEGLSRSRVRQVFGDSAIVDALFEVPVNTWQGPFRSGYGWHLVFVDTRESGEALPYEAVADAVFGDWLEAERQQHFEAAMSRMIGTYDVERRYDPASLAGRADGEVD